MPKRPAIPIERKQLPHRKCKKSVKYDTNWNNMPNEMKVMIMRNMDVITRTSLKMCSKADKCLVETFPMVVPEMIAYIAKQLPTRFSLFDSTSKEPQLKIEQHQSMVKIWKYGKLRVIRRNKKRPDAFKIAEGFFYGILLAKNIKIKSFKTDWKLNERCIPTGHMFHFDTIKIALNDPTECVRWLKFIAPGVKSIAMERFRYQIEGVGDLPCVMQAETLNLPHNDIDDEQILNLKATDFHIGFSRVTVHGIRELIKKWIDEDYPIAASFQIYCPQPVRTPLIREELFYGMNYTYDNHAFSYAVTMEMGTSKILEMELSKFGMIKGMVKSKT